MFSDIEPDNANEPVPFPSKINWLSLSVIKELWVFEALCLASLMVILSKSQRSKDIQKINLQGEICFV